MDSQDNGDCFINVMLGETKNIMFESQIPSTLEVDSSSQIEMNNKKKRGINFTTEEDVILVSCWLNTSIDPVIGSDQKATTFWYRVLELYIESTRFKYSERTMTSLTCRWQTIQKAVNKFQGFFAQIEARRQSGTTEQNKIDEAKVMYRSIQKSTFLFENCWSILRKESKWMTHTSLNSSKRKISYPSPNNAAAINLDDTTTSVDELANLERPIGKKAAKEKLKRGNNKEKYYNLANIIGLVDWKEDKKKMHEEKMSIQERKIKIQEEKLKIISLDMENSSKIEDKKIELEQKKFQRQEEQDEMNIMLMDTNSLDEGQRKYIEMKRAQILAKII